MDQSLNWIEIGQLTDIPRQGSRRVDTDFGEIAIFRTTDDKVFALDNRCPHKKGPLSEGIIHGGRVTCPLHNWVIELSTGEVTGPDEGCVPTFPVDVRDGRLLLAKSALETFAQGSKECDG